MNTGPKQVSFFKGRKSIDKKEQPLEDEMDTSDETVEIQTDRGGIEDSLSDNSRKGKPEDTRFFSLALKVILVVFSVMVTAFILSFFTTLKGAEQTLVPDIQGEKLVDALILLHDKELYPRVQVRFTSDPLDKDTIISQDPPGGTIVRAGRRVTLMVSKGAVVDRVDNFVGQKINEVRLELQMLFATYKPLLKINEPVIYEFDDSEPGTIIAQYPDPGTEIAGLTDLELVVSRGPGDESYTVDDYKGMNYMDVLHRLARRNIPFMFRITDSSRSGWGSLIVTQNPEAEATVGSGTLIQLTMGRPEDIPRDEIFGFLEYELPRYEVYADLKQEEIISGKRKTLFTMKHPGGPISIPYQKEEGTILILSVFGDELIRYEVRP